MKPTYLVAGLVLACSAAVYSFPTLTDQLGAVSEKAADGPSTATLLSSIDPSDLSALQKTADTLIDREEYAAALELLNKAVAAHDEDRKLVHVWKDRAFVRTQLDDRHGALDDINKAISFGADSAWTWSWRGRLHLETGDLHAAIPDLGKALERDPNRCDALRRIRLLASTLERLADEGKTAVADFDEQDKPFEIRTLVSKHLAAAEGNEYQTAIAVLDQLIEIADRPEPLKLQRAKLNARLGKLDAAITELEQIERPPEHYRNVFQDQIAHSEQLKSDGKACAGKEVSRAANSFAFLSESIAEEHVVTLVELEDFETALATLDAWLQTSPLDNRGWTWRGNILTELGEQDQALASYKEALKLIDTGEGRFHRDDWLHLETLYRIKSIYEDMGRSDEVFGVFEASLAKADNSLFWNLREMMQIAGHYDGKRVGGSHDETKIALQSCLADTACHWQQIWPKMTNQRPYRGKGSVLRY